MEKQGNFFGKRLEQLLLTSNVKSATVAAALSYDVSYISKWITGKALPSRKNMEKVVTVISDVILEQASEQALQTLKDGLNAKDAPALRAAIASSLWDAYYETTGQIHENQYVHNGTLKVMPREDFPLLEEFARSLNPEKPLRAVVMGDLFSLNRSAKLRLAGIDSGHFRLQEKQEQISMDYILDLDTLRGESVYDVILLIHMLTHFSRCDFRLFYSNWAAGKLVIALQDAFAGVSVMAGNHQFLCTTSTRDKKTVNELYHEARSLIEPDKQVFLPTNMENVLLNHEYFHNLLSQRNRWLVGHVTEHFLPKELFFALSRQYYGARADLLQETERAYLMSANALEKGRVRIMFYHLALVNFVLSGEVDFFGKKVVLPVAQRQEVMGHIRQLLDWLPGEQVRMVKEGFSDDFKYITNPCIFLSDTVPCLRLENKLYRDDLLLVKDEKVKHIFDRFFETIWNDDRDAVITDQQEILKKTDNLIETIQLM